MNRLWFYWGQPHMSFLRYMTLVSACLIHREITLVIPSTHVTPKVSWLEQQDFQNNKPGPNWAEHVLRLPIEIRPLASVSPFIAELGAPDIQTSDLLAWYLLAEHGGTVADTDILFLKPLPAITQDVQIVRYKGHPKAGYVPVGFIQGRPCQTWRDSFDKALAAYDPQVYDSCGVRCAPSDDATLSDRVVYPWAIDYPWDAYRNFLFRANAWPPIPDDCVGVHWYGGHNQDLMQQINKPEDITVGAVGWAVQGIIRRLPAELRQTVEV